MRKTILGIALVTASCLATPDQDREWATHVKCELQTAGAYTLTPLVWQQGSTPLVSLDQFRSGKALAATNTVTAVVRFGPSATNDYYVTVTNYAVSGNGYLVQMPTIGTNSAAVNWWYTAYFYRGSYLYWTGNGRLQIIETTSNDDGLTWQDVSTYSAIKDGWTNRTITINGATGSLQSNLTFTVTADTSGLVANLNGASTNQTLVTPTITTGTVDGQAMIGAETVTNIVTAATNGVLKVESDTLQSVVDRGYAMTNAYGITSYETSGASSAISGYSSNIGLWGYGGAYGAYLTATNLDGIGVTSGGGLFGVIGTASSVGGIGGYFGGPTGIVAFANDYFTAPTSIAIQAYGRVEAYDFKGDGSQLTGITAAQVGAVTPSEATNIAYSVSGITGASATTLTPIYAVATGAVTTVEWSATPRINYIALATPTTITNSLANLGNCASNATIELWVNATATAALAPVWDARVQWAQGVPDMTVTGLYKFVFSSACGTNIQARQIYPTPNRWIAIPWRASGDASAFNPINVLTSTSATGEVFTVKSDSQYPLALKYYFAALPIGLTEVFFSTRTLVQGVGYTAYDTSVGTRNIQSRSVVIMFPPNTDNPTLYHSSILRISTPAAPSGNLQIIGVSQRVMNELETAAYNAGWRP